MAGGKKAVGIVASAVIAVIGIVMLGVAMSSMDEGQKKAVDEQSQRVNAAANNFVDVCMNERSATCDQELRKVQADTCALVPTADICTDGRVEAYFAGATPAK